MVSTTVVLGAAQGLRFQPLVVCVAERYAFFFRQYAGTWGALSGGMHEVADHLGAQPSE